MKGISKTSVKGFYIILTEEKHKIGNIVENVWFNQFTKNMLKMKKAYSSDIEYEKCGEVTIFSRKVVFSLLSVNEVIDLFTEYEFCEKCNTAGSLSIEYGWLNAVSFDSFDYCNNQNTNIYISVIFDFENYENIDKDSLCMLGNYNFQNKIENEIFEALENTDYEHLHELCSKVYSYNNNQLELNFN
jgi:hypothetical protein